MRNFLIFCITLTVSLQSVLAVDKNNWCISFPPDEYVKIPHDLNCGLFYECHMYEINERGCPPGLQYNPRKLICDSQANTQCIDANKKCPDKAEYFPHPYECSLYVECFNGFAYVMTCPRDMWFDNSTTSCVTAEGECDTHITIPPPDQTTTEPSWTTPHPICFGIRPGQIKLFSYPEDCSKYYRCDGADLSVEQCPGNRLFNEAKQTCDLPTVVDCEDRPLPTTTEYPTDTTKDEHWNDPRCSDGGLSFWSDYEDCQNYIVCYDGHGHLMRCPDGFLYEEDLVSCVKSSEATCGKTTPPPTTTPITILPPNPDCEFTGQLLPYPGDCTKYYVCEWGQKVEMSCPDGLWFNIDVNQCDYPYQTTCAD